MPNGNQKRDERIRCLNCNKLFGRHDAEYIQEMIEVGKPVEPYAGPLLLLKEVIVPPLPFPGEKDDPGSQAFELDEPPSRHFKVGDKLGPYTGRKGRKVIRWLWDGESWVKPDSPFCCFECQRKKAPTFWQQVRERNKGKDE